MILNDIKYHIAENLEAGCKIVIIFVTNINILLLSLES